MACLNFTTIKENIWENINLMEVLIRRQMSIITLKHFKIKVTMIFGIFNPTPLVGMFGLALVEIVEMPSNNLTLVFGRPQTA